MVSILGGLGFGAIPVMNIIAVQHSVPKRYVGVATGSFYLMISVGIAMSPAILGSAMNTRYDKEIKTLLPNIERIADKATMASLMNPRVLLSPQSMTTLRELMYKGGSDRQLLFEQTVQAIRTSMAKSLRSVFLIGAVAMLAFFLLILALPKTLLPHKCSTGDSLG